MDAVCEEGIAYLADSHKGTDPPELIIPALPLHVAFEWLLTTLPKGAVLSRLKVPAEVLSQLPNPSEGVDGQIYTSYADFICPDDCPEPQEICTHTGKVRKGILHETLANIQSAEFTSIVVRSRQIAPGLGGYQPDDLFAALSGVLTAGGPVLLSTACKCHGVIQAFNLTNHLL
jgi:hypothetical protein